MSIAMQEFLTHYHHLIRSYANPIAGYTVRTAAHRLGVDPKTLRRYADRQGIVFTTKRTPTAQNRLWWQADEIRKWLRTRSIWRTAQLMGINENTLRAWRRRQG